MWALNESCQALLEPELVTWLRFARRVICLHSCDLGYSGCVQFAARTLTAARCRLHRSKWGSGRGLGFNFGNTAALLDGWLRNQHSRRAVGNSLGDCAFVDRSPQIGIVPCSGPIVFLVSLQLNHSAHLLPVNSTVNRLLRSPSQTGARSA